VKSANDKVDRTTCLDFDFVRISWCSLQSLGDKLGNRSSSSTGGGLALDPLPCAKADGSIGLVVLISHRHRSGEPNEKQSYKANA
jgi:hypothetical protein